MMLIWVMWSGFTSERDTVIGIFVVLWPVVVIAG